MNLEATDKIRLLDDDGEACVTIDAATGEVDLIGGLDPSTASRMFWREVHVARGEEVDALEVIEGHLERLSDALGLPDDATVDDAVEAIQALQARPSASDASAMVNNLTATQKRCTELLLGFRGLKAASDHETVALALVVDERRRQDEKWGAISGTTLLIPNGTGTRDAVKQRDAYQQRADRAEEHGDLTWSHILAEECAEALAESEPNALRAELVQVAAVAVKWIEVLDRRADLPYERSLRTVLTPEAPAKEFARRQNGASHHEPDSGIHITVENKPGNR